MSVTPYPIEERAAALRAAFGSDVFTTRDAERVFKGYSYSFARNTVCLLTKRGDVKRVATRKQLEDYLPARIAADFYAFDFTKTEDDVLEKFDPVPPEERTIEVQLFGDELERYQEIRDHIFGGNYWEQREKEYE